MISYTWVENDPKYIQGYVYARLPSGVNIFGIRKRWMGGIFNPRYEWVAQSELKNIESNRPIGGFFLSFEEAKASADHMISRIFRDTP